MKYDFSKFQPKDVDDAVAGTDVHKIIGGIVFRGADEPPMSEIGRLIYKGKEVEISDNQMEKIKKSLVGQVMPFVLLQFNEFVEKTGVK